VAESESLKLDRRATELDKAIRLLQEIRLIRRGSTPEAPDQQLDARRYKRPTSWANKRSTEE
jgi:hypothetical protein